MFIPDAFMCYYVCYVRPEIKVYKKSSNPHGPHPPKRPKRSLRIKDLYHHSQVPSPPIIFYHRVETRILAMDHKTLWVPACLPLQSTYCRSSTLLPKCEHTTLASSLVTLPSCLSSRSLRPQFSLKPRIIYFVLSYCGLIYEAVPAPHSIRLHLNIL